MGDPPLKILIVRLSAHGDVIQTLPLLAVLKAHHSNIQVGWVVEASAAPLLENHPLIDYLHVSHRKAWIEKLIKRPWRLFTVVAGIVSFIRGLRRVGYDVGLDVQGLFKSGVLLYLAGIPRRLGYERTREHAALFYTETLPYHDLTNPSLPTVVKFMEFAQRLGLLNTQTVEDTLNAVQFPLPVVTERTRKRAQLLLDTLEKNKPIVVLAPFTIWPSKQWPINYWRDLLVHLVTRSFNLVVMGSPSDREQACSLLESFSSDLAVHDWVGKTELMDLYVLFESVDMLIGLDSALLHVANAVASQHHHPKILGIYGPTSANRTGPTGYIHRTVSTTLPCQPCFERRCPIKTTQCMLDIGPDKVIKELDSLMASLTYDVPTPERSMPGTHGATP